MSSSIISLLLPQVEEVTHHLVGASSPPDFYTIKEEVEFSITIKEKKAGVWVPFTGTDVQVSCFLDIGNVSNPDCFFLRTGSMANIETGQ